MMSLLWKVYDTSTGEVMADFYKPVVEGNGKVMKGEALRQAQLVLLEGRIKPAPNYADPPPTRRLTSFIRTIGHPSCSWATGGRELTNRTHHCRGTRRGAIGNGKHSDWNLVPCRQVGVRGCSRSLRRYQD